MAILTRDEMVAKIIELEIEFTAMEARGEPHNKTLPVLRQLQKLRDSL